MNSLVNTKHLNFVVSHQTIFMKWTKSVSGNKVPNLEIQPLLLCFVSRNPIALYLFQKFKDKFKLT